MVEPSPWRQIAVRFTDPHTAERYALDGFGPVLLRADTTGLVTSWSFIRKSSWRFRYISANTVRVTTLLQEAANRRPRRRGSGSRRSTGRG